MYSYMYTILYTCVYVILKMLKLIVLHVYSRNARGVSDLWLGWNRAKIHVVGW